MWALLSEVLEVGEKEMNSVVMMVAVMVGKWAELWVARRDDKPDFLTAVCWAGE